MSYTHDALIFGGGLAGSILADQMIRSGRKPMVIGETRLSRCSRIAAGLINPIGGKRLNLVWNADTFIPYSKNYYQGLEEEIGIRFFHTRDFARIFASPDEEIIWSKKRSDPEYQAWIDELESLAISKEFNWQNEHGFKIQGGGYVDTLSVLEELGKKLDDHGGRTHSAFRYDELALENNSVSWNQFKAPFAIFSEGHHATSNPWFPNIPYRPAKGVIGRISTNAPLADTVILKGYFIIPRHDSTCYVGATYDWNNRDDNPDEASISSLESFLRKEFPYRWTWDTLDAGVRPATAGAKPVVGPSSAHDRIFSFNGFGSKGCMQIPYIASQLINHLYEDGELTPEILPSRFEKKSQAEPNRWRAVEIARDHVLEKLKPADTVIDATAGNGHDTLWLAKAVGDKGKVFAFDIQAEAIDIASDRIGEAGLSDRVQFIHASHDLLSENLPLSAKGRISAIVFNLGYLPNSETALITTPTTTLSALQQSLDWLKTDGVLSIVIYPGHPGGSEEANTVKDWVADLNPHKFQTKIHEHPTGILDSPIPIIVQKLDPVQSPLTTDLPGQ